MKKTLFSAWLLASLSFACGQGQPSAPAADTLAAASTDTLAPAPSPEHFCSLEDRAKIESLLDSAQAWPDTTSPGRRVASFGMALLATPYIPHTLEGQPSERLVVRADGLDCVTFLESALALSMASRRRPDFDGYLQALAALRYRDGLIDGYPSRLHYFTDWLHDNARRGHLRDITAELGGQPYPNRVDFMSQHPGSYEALADTANLRRVQEVERAISARSYHYIPKDSVRALEAGIRDGDLVIITTNVPGLDASHVGLALWKGPRLHLLHASDASGCVELSAKPLHELLAGYRIQTGIMVARPL